MFSNQSVHDCCAADPPLSLVLLEISPTAPEPEAPPEQRATWPSASHYQIRREYKPLHASVLFHRGDQPQFKLEATDSKLHDKQRELLLVVVRIPWTTSTEAQRVSKRKYALRLNNFVLLV